MNPSLGNLRRLSIDEIKLVDRICLDFEDQWLSGKQPEILQFVANLDGRTRTATLIELIAIDVEYQPRKGESQPIEYYLKHFPEDMELVKTAFTNRINGHVERQSWRELNSHSSFPFSVVSPDSEYQIERFLARGGLGEIFLARDKRLDRIVAIKVPRNRDPNSAERQRLSREAEITGKLKHPGIVPIHTSGQDLAGQPYYVMQYVEGRTMKDAISDWHQTNESGDSGKFATFEFRRLLQSLISVCNTVAYAHEQGYIHRDIKPGNIILGEFGETVLLDWGLAKQFEEVKSSSDESHVRALSESWSANRDDTIAATNPGQPIGTPEFASPEQVQGRIDHQDERSDVYSLGATLYFLITGSRTLDPDDLTDFSKATAIRKIPAPLDLNSSIPVDLNAICTKAIAFDPEDRYQSVYEFSAELERYIADEPIETRRQSSFHRIRRWVKSNPRKTYSMTSGATVAMFALVVSAILLNQKAVELKNSLATQQRMNSELKAAKESAEDYAEKTELALRTMADRIDQTWFAGRKKFSERERHLLDDMLVQYQQHARSIPDAYRTKTLEAEAYERVGMIQMLLGQSSKAIDSFRNAGDLLSQLPDSAAERVRMTQANTAYQLGALLTETGESRAGLAQLETAFRLTKAVEKEFPKNSDHTNRLAIIQARIGTTWLELNKQQPAFEHLNAAKVITGRLVERFPDNKQYQGTFATRMSRLAKAHLQYSEFDLALQEYQSAVAVFNGIEDGEWIFAGVRRGLDYCVACNGVARCLKMVGRDEDSQIAWETALGKAEQMVELYPSFPNAYSNLAVPMQQIAALHRQRSNWPEAVDFAQSAVEAIDKTVELAPEQLNYYRFRTVLKKELGLILHASGDLVAAEQALRESVAAAKESFDLAPDRSHGKHSNLLEYARTLGCLGEVKFARGDIASARSTFQQAIKLLESAAPSILSSPHCAKEFAHLRSQLDANRE